MKTKIIAHRGASRLERENTLAAFQKAIELGADAIELDVRQTKDGRLAVIHDPKIYGRKVSRLTFEQLNVLASRKNFQVPELYEVLELAKGKVEVQIEIKTTGYENKVAQTALSILEPETFSIISFNFSSLKRLYQANPRLVLGMIVGAGPRHLTKTLMLLVRGRGVLGRMSYLALDFRLLVFGFDKILPKNYPITAWTIDGRLDMQKAWGFSRLKAIASNVPDLALAMREKFGP